MAETGATRRAFVTGWPLTSTRSPLIHNGWARMYGLDASSEAVPMSPDDAQHFLRTLGSQGFLGGNVTMPHKELAAETAQYRSPTVKRLAGSGVGSANTLWLDENGELACDSTDGFGFTANLDEHAPGWDVDARSRTALVLGAGGAALAIVDALVERGFGRIVIANRTHSRADTLASRFRQAEAVDWTDIDVGSADMIVNTTALGMSGTEPQANYPPNLERAKPQTIVNDLVYAPLRTPLLEAAERAGLLAIDGLGMLLHQAVPGFERWFGIRPQVTARIRRLVVQDLEETETVFLGLTGSIGMGKSTTAEMFRELDIPIHDADKVVHQLYAGRAAPLIEAEFPGTTDATGVNRDALRETVLGNSDAMKRLESIIHPLVREENLRFRRAAKSEKRPLAVMDVPLLFETDGDMRCEAVVTVTAPEEVQRERVLARGTMDADAFDAILARQVPDAEKRARSDFVIDTSRGLAHARARVRDIATQLSDPTWAPTIRRLSTP